MEAKTIEKIIQKMKSELTENQLLKLTKACYEAIQETSNQEQIDYISKFLDSKKIEGCSKRTINSYLLVLRYFESKINISLCSATTDCIRTFLSTYQQRNKCSNSTLDNIRRVLSSFYKWLESEDYIIKNPMIRIHKVKVPITVKSIYSDEDIISMREHFSSNIRNLAIFDLLISSGLRIGELVLLNKDDIDFDNRSAIVYGKGAKERCIYFDVKTKMSLLKYLEQRDDDENALFVTERKYTCDSKKHRLSINQIEFIIRDCGKINNNIHAYPHKFRRTLATKAIDKGMPIEQVQILLGHTKIDTTLKYAKVQQKNVIYSYQKYI